MRSTRPRRPLTDTATSETLLSAKGSAAGRPARGPARHGEVGQIARLALVAGEARAGAAVLGAGRARAQPGQEAVTSSW